MRTRDIHIQFWLNEMEAEAFSKAVKRSGLSREAYLRQLIKGLVPTDVPPPDYHTMMKELRAIGTNLDHVAQKAYVLNVIDAKRYDEAAVALDKAIVGITNAVMLPRKIDRTWLLCP